MATTLGPDLEAARKAVEKLQDDTCRIYRTGAIGSGVANDPIDPETGQVVSNAPTLIYPTQAMIDADDSGSIEALGGPVQFRTVGEGFTTTQTRTQGGDPEIFRMYNVRLPINDCPFLQEGDLIICTSSRRDPLLVDNRFRVREVTAGTFSISRKLLAERLNASPQ